MSDPTPQERPPRQIAILDSIAVGIIIGVPVGAVIVWAMG